MATLGEKLSWGELTAALYFLSACAVAVTFLTEVMFQAIEEKRQEMEERAYWRSLWQFPDARRR